MDLNLYTEFKEHHFIQSMNILGDDSYPEEHGCEMLEHTFLPLPACLFSVRESVSCVVAKCSALPLVMEDLVLLNKFLDYYYECVFSSYR